MRPSLAPPQGRPGSPQRQLSLLAGCLGPSDAHHGAPRAGGAWHSHLESRSLSSSQAAKEAGDTPVAQTRERVK